MAAMDLDSKGFTSNMTGRCKYQLFAMILISWILLLAPRQVTANWMYLGIASVGMTSAPTSHMCNLIPGLVYQQLRVCQDNPQAMPCVSLGAKLGILECQGQFRYERWNCSTSPSTHTVFGTVLDKGTRETAFIYAITSAGVVHAVTASCSAGNLTDCACDMTRQGHTSEDGWKWGGCSDNVDYGTWFARTFVDAPEKLKHAQSKDVRALMNLHNNAAGRETVADQLQLKCRCHGVSGSCAVKTCWRTMPTFQIIGKNIKSKYEDSVQIAPKSSNKLRRKDKRLRRAPIDQTELVHLASSPNYCRTDPKRGLMGTKGRECKKDSYGPDSCDLLCCGRGYNTKIVRYVERCHCKFIWCCEVRCKICETMMEIHQCK